MELPSLPRRPRRAARLSPEACPLRASCRRTTQSPRPGNCRPPVQGAVSPAATLTSPMGPWWPWSTCPSSAPTGSSWLRRSRPRGPRFAGTEEETRVSERRTQNHPVASSLTTAPRRSVFPAWPFLAGGVQAPVTHPPGGSCGLAAAAGRQSAASVL